MRALRTVWRANRFQEGGENDPINQLLAYHVDLTTPSFGIQEEHNTPDEIFEMMPGTPRIRNGYLYGNDKPGLGIDIDEKIAAKYPLRDDYHNADWTSIRGMDGSVVKP